MFKKSERLKNQINNEQINKDQSITDQKTPSSEDKQKSEDALVDWKKLKHH